MEPLEEEFSMDKLPRIIQYLIKQLFSLFHLPPHLKCVRMKDLLLPSNLIYFLKPVCGGTIISKDSIITAGHCVDGKTSNDVSVLVGTNQLDNGGTSYPCDSIIIHDAFNAETNENDIALVKIKGSISFTDEVQLILLAKVYITSLTNLPVVLSGWGAITANGPISNELRYVERRTISHENCSAQYDNELIILPNQMCTFSEDIYNVVNGSCTGDAGGPLTYNGMLLGVLSQVGACVDGKPDIFTTVPHYFLWIMMNCDATFFEPYER